MNANCSEARGATPALSAKPITWEPDGDRAWTGSMGFHVEFDADESAESGFVASWGEGDSDNFATLEEAQAWCQALADSWIREWGQQPGGDALKSMDMASLVDAADGEVEIGDDCVGVPSTVTFTQSGFEKFCNLLASRLSSGGDLAPSAGVALIAAERQRQITAEGWTPEHDDEHACNELAAAAACYAAPETLGYVDDEPSRPRESILAHWPWALQWWKPGDRIRELTKAGALIAAEIDRLQRVKAEG